MTPETLANAVNDFLSVSNSAVVIEDGAVAFDLATTKYTVSGEHNKCLLHLWSAERNVVRRVLEAEVKNETLRLAVQRLGHSKPSKLEICRQRDRRSSNARRVTRIAYQRRLERILARTFPGYTCERFRTSMDLEQSFGPIYSRGVLRKAQSAYAVLGVNDEETQSSIDAALTFGILWLDICRRDLGTKATVHGLTLVLPRKTAQLTRERMAHLHPEAVQWKLYEFDEKESSLAPVEIGDRGNLSSHLARLTDETSARERFFDSIARVHDLMPEAQTIVLSPTEIAFRHYGLEFARARLAHDPCSLKSLTEVVFGLGAEERVLDANTLPAFINLIRTIGEARHPQGPRDNMVWRMHPERWLESLVMRDVSALDGILDPACAYSQMPACVSSDRALMDVLTVTRDGRLAVLELKASEDIHLPLQGLDYWTRVSWHHAHNEFSRHGYFSGRELSLAPPLLYLVAPALQIHPTTDTILRYFSPTIEWHVLGIDERWRDSLRVVVRKRPPRV